jgi:hypothetical protein
MLTDAIIQRAWKRADARCECTRIEHNHPDRRCGNWLISIQRGTSGLGGWEAHCRDSDDGDELSNCEILCWGCYRALISHSSLDIRD